MQYLLFIYRINVQRCFSVLPLSFSDTECFLASKSSCYSLKAINKFVLVCILNAGLLLSSSLLSCLFPQSCRASEGQQRVAGCYLNLMSQIKTLYLAYCSSHPLAVSVLTDHRSAIATQKEKVDLLRQLG